MTSKERTYKERDNDEKKGKKRFLERMAEDHEAEQAIEDFLKGREENEISLDNPQHRANNW